VYLGETVAVYCENHAELMNTLGGQNAVFFNVKDDDGTWSNQCTLQALNTEIRTGISQLET
jgi:hypothetical protein